MVIRGRARGGSRRDEVETVYGLSAVRAVLAKRPEDLVRIAHTKEARGVIGEILRAAAARRVPYKEVPTEELDRIAQSTHHEGICVGVRARAVLTVDALVELLKSDSRGCAVALDRVGNPHNLGGMVRSAAYFGIPAMLLSEEEGQAQWTASAVRVAEGGAESVALCRTDVLATALGRLRARGVTVVGTDAQSKLDAFEYRWRAPCVLVIGSEHSGISRSVRAQCDALVSVRGVGAVDSLNASVAAGIVLALMARG